MAMYIKYSPDSKLVSQWYIGMPVPAITSSVVTFQADGDELTLILAAMNSKIIVPREESTKETNKTEVEDSIPTYEEILTDKLSDLLYDISYCTNTEASSRNSLVEFLVELDKISRKLIEKLNRMESK